MADINSLTAYRAIVDNEGKPLPEFMLMWQALLDHISSIDIVATFYELADNQQAMNFGAVYTAGLANVRAIVLAEAGGATPRAGIGVQWITTNGMTWVSGGTETLLTVSAGDLFIYMSGPLMALNADGPSSGEFRVLEGGSTTVYTGTWSADGDGVSWSLARNESAEDTMTTNIPRVSTGTVQYDIEFRVLAGNDLDLLSYIYAERT